MPGAMGNATYSTRGRGLMIARRQGTCRTCKQRFDAGEEIHWSREDGEHHIKCWWSGLQKEYDEAAEALAERLGFRKLETIGDN